MKFEFEAIPETKEILWYSNLDTWEEKNFGDPEKQTEDCKNLAKQLGHNKFLFCKECGEKILDVVFINFKKGGFYCYNHRKKAICNFGEAKQVLRNKEI